MGTCFELQPVVTEQASRRPCKDVVQKQLFWRVSIEGEVCRDGSSKKGASSSNKGQSGKEMALFTSSQIPVLSGLTGRICCRHVQASQ